MTFNEWLIEEYGQNWQGIHMDLVENGLNESQLNAKQNDLLEQFEDYMELHVLEIVPE